jgi:hypothetical protein
MRRDWTDFNESDPGITLLEVFAFLVEALSYVHERIEVAQRRRALRRYALAVGTTALLVYVWWRSADGTGDE